MKRYYDVWHQLEEFKPDDNIWLNAKDMMTKLPSKKLDYKHLVPFRIIRKVSELAYELKLPASLKIHPVISASWLELDEWQRLCPCVTLKICDPHTGDIIDSVETPILVQDFERRYSQETFSSTWRKWVEQHSTVGVVWQNVHVTFLSSSSVDMGTGNALPIKKSTCPCGCASFGAAGC